MPGIDITEARSAIADDPVNILSSGGDGTPMEVVTWHPEAFVDLSNWLVPMKATLNNPLVSPVAPPRVERRPALFCFTMDIHRLTT